MKIYRLDSNNKPELAGGIGSMLHLKDIKKTTERGILVSTMFLSIDHNYSNSGAPVLFETMIFGGWQDGYQDRCSTYCGALVMHAKACELAFAKKFGPLWLKVKWLSAIAAANDYFTFQLIRLRRRFR